MDLESSPIIKKLVELYLSDKRPWIVGYSGGKDSTMVVSLVFEVVFRLLPTQRIKDVSIVCTDTRVEIPAIADRIEGELALMQLFSDKHHLKISTHILKRRAEQSFWTNLIGRGYPPPNRLFRWCTQRLKIDPVSEFIRTKVGQWGEAIILLAA